MMKPQKSQPQIRPLPGTRQSLLALDPPIQLEQLPESDRNRCVKLLSELLLAVLRGEQQEGGRDEH